MGKQFASLLVGDHLGQVKRVLLPSGEISTLPELAAPSSSNPVVSIEQIGTKSRHLLANANGELYIYDSVHGMAIKKRESGGGGDDGNHLVKAIPVNDDDIVLVYEKQLVFAEAAGAHIKQKKGQIKDVKVHGEDKKLAIVGKDIPLKIFDLETRNKIYEADPPENDWLGIRPPCVVASLDFVGRTRIATCSKSDSVIRVYDTLSKPKPIISIDMKQTAFNEHADSGRFVSVASTGDQGHCIVVGSNVGQILAIDLRFGVKQMPKKKLQPRAFKILGGFKGARGATIKDVKIVPARDRDNTDYKVISCCLDRYLRIHDLSKTARQLSKHVYMKTKPLCCSPVFYEDP